MDKSPVRTRSKQRVMNYMDESAEVVVDLSYDAMMPEKDAADCVDMCLRIDTANRRSEKPFLIHYTGFRPDGSVQKHLKRNSYRHWAGRFNTEHFMKLFDTKKLVYLTSESDNVIETLEPSNIYVLGGLVDHNKHGNQFLRLAEEFGIQHARLPIFEHIIINSSTVLKIDQVFKMISFMNAGKTWKQTLVKIMPSMRYTLAKAEKASIDKNEPLQVRLPESKNRPDKTFISNRPVKEMVYVSGSPEVVVDLNFGHILSDVEAVECVKELARIDKMNRGAKKPIPLTFCSLRSCVALKDCIMGNELYLQWAVRYTPDRFWELYDKEKIIYITNDSDNVIDTLQLNHVYVIGGLLDHNKHGQRFRRLAEEHGVRHARLPLGEHLIANNTGFTISQIFEILLCIHSGKGCQKIIGRGAGSSK